MTLSSLGREVLVRFEAASSSLRMKRPQQLEANNEAEDLIENLTAEQERFQLWAANLGLQALGDRSLDYRIKDSTSLQSYSNQLLYELSEDLSDLYEFLVEGHGARKDRADNSSEDEQSEDSDEEGQQELQPATTRSITEAVKVVVEDISDIVDRLYRLAAKLRSSADRALPSRQNFFREPLTEPDGGITYLTNSERKLAEAQTEDLHLRRLEEIIRQSQRDESGNTFPREDGTPDLSARAKAMLRRIAKGNAYRQQQFMFWRRREWTRRNDIMHESLPPPIVPTQELHKLTNVEQEGLNMPSRSKAALSHEPSATWKMPKELNLAALDETRSLPSNTEITATPTVYDPSGRKVGWPKFPEELGKKKDFICPYCFVTCPAKYRGKAHWRKHLIQDLQPYTCTARVCNEGDNKLLNTWEEWIIHEQVYHRMEYICPDHSEQVFETREVFFEHITQEHSAASENPLQVHEIDKYAHLMPQPQGSCPLCPYEAETWAKMDKHLAFHLESLSLLSLPLTTGLEKDDASMGSPQLDKGEGDGDSLISNIFEDENESLNEEHQLVQGDKVTLAALEGFDSKTPALISEDDVRLWTAATGTSKMTLRSAAETGDEATVSWMLDTYVDLEEQDWFCLTALSFAAKNGHEAVVKLLLDRGANLETRSSQRQTPLFLAVIGGHEAVARLLIDRGANIGVTDGNANTALAWAAYRGEKTIVELLLDNGASLDTKNENGESPLSYAAWNEHEEVARVLLERGADPNMKNKQGQTALFLAARQGNETIIKMLLRVGAGIDLLGASLTERDLVERLRHELEEEGEAIERA